MIMIFTIPVVAICGVYLLISHPTSATNGSLTVSFLDVGQGDSIFIESPVGTQVIIDGGPDSRVLGELTTEMGIFDKTIDLLVATHPDRDHIAGLVDVLSRYKVSTIVLTTVEGESSEYQMFKDAVISENATIIEGYEGEVFDLGSGTAGAVMLTLLFPPKDMIELDTNTSSIVAKLTYGNTSFLLTGDSPRSIESYLVSRYGESLHSTVLKVGHHGSRSSSGEDFLDAVAPRVAIIESGKDNPYGHPHKEVIDALKKRDILIKNTAIVGSIRIGSDGKMIYLRN